MDQLPHTRQVGALVFVPPSALPEPCRMMQLPACRVLAANQGLVRGKRVLEIGCGCALVGILAAQFGAEQVSTAWIAEPGPSTSCGCSTQSTCGMQHMLNA